MVFTPKKLPGFSATLDYYDIKIDETIGTLGADDIQNQCATTGDAFLCGLIHRDRSGTLWLTNDAYTITTNQNVGMRQFPGPGHHRQLQPRRWATWACCRST